jgi:hypothetical protein
MKSICHTFDQARWSFFGNLKKEVLSDESYLMSHWVEWTGAHSLFNINLHWLTEYRI